MPLLMVRGHCRARSFSECSRAQPRSQTFLAVLMCCYAAMPPNAAGRCHPLFPCCARSTALLRSPLSSLTPLTHCRTPSIPDNLHVRPHSPHTSGPCALHTLRFPIPLRQLLVCASSLLAPCFSQAQRRSPTLQTTVKPSVVSAQGLCVHPVLQQVAAA